MSACNVKDSILNYKFKYEYVETNYEGKEDPLNKSLEKLNNYSKILLSTTISNSLQTFFTKSLKNIDTKLEKDFRIYKSTKQYLIDISESNTLQELKHYFGNFKNKEFNEAKHKLLTLHSRYLQERNTYDDSYVGNLDNKLKDNFNTEEIKDLNTIFARSGFFSLLDPELKDIYTKLIHGVSPKDLLTELESNDKSGVIKNVGVEYGKFLLGKKSNINLTSLYKTIYSETTKKYIKAYATLYVLNNTNNFKNIFTKILKNNKDIYDELIIASKSLKELHNKLFENTKDAEYTDLNLINDIYPHNYTYKVLDINNIKSLDTNEWKILRYPTDKQLGIAYKKTDINLIEGIGTGIYYRHNHIVIDDSLKEQYEEDPYIKHIFMGKDSTKLNVLTLTIDEKRNLGLIENPAHTLYRSISRYKYMLDSNQLRKELVNNFTFIVDLKNIKDITSKYSTDKHPWFLKLDKNITYDMLPDEIKKKYKVATNKSNIDNFSKNIDLVRKDIAPWLMNQHKVTFKKSKTLNKTLQILQKLVLMSKIKQLLWSPTKLTMDYISNNLLLLTKGVPIHFILKETPKVSNALKDLQILQNELLLATFKLNADPDNKTLQKKVKTLENKLKKHPYNFIHYEGFVQSLSTDVILKDFDSISGLHKDIKDVVSMFIKKANSEDINALGTILEKLMEHKITHLDKVLYKLASIGKEGGINYNLKEIANNLKRTRETKDIEQFISNLIYTPGSEVTKIGTLLMQYSDSIPRIILYRYLRHKNVSHTKAVLDAHETFIDYRPNMPKELQFLSDTFLVPYPAFLIKVQRVILNLLKDKPTTAGVQLLTDLLDPNIYGINVSQFNILGSNIITKYENNQLLTSPTITDISPIQKIPETIWDIIL